MAGKKRNTPIGLEGDGHVLAEVSIGLHPYGAAIDSKGILWSTQQATGNIVSVDTNNNTAGEVIQIAGWTGSYGIAVDGQDRSSTKESRSRAIVPYRTSVASTGTLRAPSSGETQPGSTKRETS